MLTVDSIIHQGNPKAGDRLACQLCLKNIEAWALKMELVLEVSDLMERKDVPKLERYEDSEIAGWYPVLMGEQATRIMFYCPACKTPRDLKNHEIAANGEVSPEVMCPCGGYHEEVKLLEWDPDLRKERGDRFAQEYETA